MNLGRRLKSALSLVLRGSIAPFDRLVDLSGLSGAEKVARPYAQSLWVARAIKMVCDPVTSVPLRFSLEERGSDPVDDPILDDAWGEPAIGPEGPVCLRDVISATLGWIKLTGEAFWVFDDRVLLNPKALPFPDVGLSTLPRFFIARPDRMRHVTTEGGTRLAGWEYTDGTGRKHTLLPEQVVHPKLWNPYDDIRGLGEYEQARLAAESDYMGATFKLNLARNNGDQGVYIVAKSGIPDDAQRKQIIAQLREKREMQQRGQFKPVFLTGDISIEDPKVRVVDQAFNESMMQDAHRVFIAFGVPPSMADVVASYSVGSASDYYRLIRDTCVPAGVLFGEAVERALTLQGRDGVYAWFDWSNHPVMKEVRREAITAATPLWDRGISWETINDTFDLGLPEFDGWDRRYLPFSVTPADDLQAMSTPDAVAGADVSAPDEEMDAEDDANESDIAQMMRALRSPRAKARDPREVELWKSHFAKRRATAKVYLARFNKVLFEARAEVLRNIEANTVQLSAGKPNQRAAAADLIFDLGTFRDAIVVNLRGAALNALTTAGQQLFDEVKKDDVFKMPDATAKLFLAQRENRIKDASDEVWTAIKNELQSGIDDGDSTRELASRIRSKFNQISRGRAERIAMTETSAAYGEARQVAMEQAGVQFKQWLTSGLPNVRTAHAAANGQIVRIDQPFEVGGESLQGPGDPSGSPENVINCHCVSVAVAAPESES
jgi:SPP1 gp7 family putative phage head morphogenesis protein